VLDVLASCASIHVPQHRMTAINAVFPRMHSLLGLGISTIVVALAPGLNPVDALENPWPSSTHTSRRLDRRREYLGSVGL
jgi:hypothetical protein